MTNDFDTYSQRQDLGPSAQEILAYTRRMLALAGAYVRANGVTKDWSWLRPSIDRRVHHCGAHSIVHHLAWPNRWSQAGGPYMQQQAVLRTVTPRTGDASAELQEKGQEKA